ncbi:hypothetical protein BJ170DRAFT_163181 [Xylariales sp. AK1849]|nr:hypothetical protein BJ170DRAFT_163181 [Xylariales sp. AK1849]
MLETYFPQQDLSLLQRMLLIWAFVASAFVIVVQISQSWAEPRPRWTVTTSETKPYWYTFYTFVAFLFMQVAYGPLRWNLEGKPWLGGLEVHVLDALWIGLLGLEAAMLAYVFALRLSKSVRREGKVKEL